MKTFSKTNLDLHSFTPSRLPVLWQRFCQIGQLIWVLHNANSESGQCTCSGFTERQKIVKRKLPQIHRHQQVLQFVTGSFTAEPASSIHNSSSKTSSSVFKNRNAWSSWRDSTVLVILNSRWCIIFADLWMNLASCSNRLFRFSWLVIWLLILYTTPRSWITLLF